MKKNLFSLAIIGASLAIVSCNNPQKKAENYARQDSTKAENYANKAENESTAAEENAGNAYGYADAAAAESAMSKVSFPSGLKGEAKQIAQDAANDMEKAVSATNETQYNNAVKQLNDLKAKLKNAEVDGTVSASDASTIKKYVDDLESAATNAGGKSSSSSSSSNSTGSSSNSSSNTKSSGSK